MPLRLKSLELHGYKTFASRTVFEFAGGITAIVGPNGSGKSNIADALRWVLGEQSYSLLRGKKTEDMIFAGSEQRPRAGMAAATITFDNAENWLPVEFSEVALSRRAYRDGRNDYLLNSQNVRLREINELLAQSGLSERTYTIIGQGLVDASLALRADERRRLFEEAAGIGLYRSRREEALKRLDTTQRNLDRVLDILAELEPRLRSLERQAKRAQEYSQIQADLRALLREWYGFHWHRYQFELAEAREALQSHEGKVVQARDTYQKLEIGFTHSREQLQDLRTRISSWNRQSAETLLQREAVSRNLAVMDERRRSMVELIQNLDLEKQKNADELDNLKERIEEIRLETDRLASERDESLAQEKLASDNLGSKRLERSEVEAKLQTVRQDVSNLVSKQARLQARRDEVENRLKLHLERLQNTERAIETAREDLSRVESSGKTAQESARQVGDSFKDAESELRRLQSELVEIEKSRRAKQEQRASLDAELVKLKTQLEVLNQADRNLVGYADGARFLLKAAHNSRLSGSLGALNTILEVPEGLEIAIAAALGDQLDAIVLKSGTSVDEALRLLDAEDSARASILPLDWLIKVQPLSPPEDPDCLGVASNMVKVGPGMQSVIDMLLGHSLIARERNSARRLLKGQPSTARVVTLNGEVFKASGEIQAGRDRKGMQLSRPRQRKEIQVEIEQKAQLLARRDEEIRIKVQDYNELQQKLRDAEARVNSIKKALDEKVAQEQKASMSVESAHRQLEWQTAQWKNLEADLAADEAEKKSAQDGLVQLEMQLSDRQELLRSVSAELAGHSLDELRSQAAYWNTRSAVADQALEDARTRLQEREKAQERLASQIASIETRKEETSAAISRLEKDKEALKRQETELNGVLEELSSKIGPAEAELVEAENRESRLQEQETAAQRSLALIERQNAQLQLELTRKQESLENLRRRIEDDFGLVAFEYANDVSGPVPLPLDGMVEQLPVVEKVSPDLEDALTQKRSQLRRMGAINLEARHEFESVRDRYGFMQGQVADLRKAQEDLRQVIAELDELTRREFHKTFEAVANHFREIFTRLFGGGSARLVLTDPQNLTDTGIDIEARLPGRREQGLSLLSGGERSLTAIALVFALLRVSPTPFCVLDEVDAMLDEANVGRFRDLLAELSEETQFVIVTHNRNTVQAADVIYGVTMGRDSSSQVISLKLDEVSDEMLRGTG